MRGLRVSEKIKFEPCGWEDIRQLVVEYITKNNITVDSFWEEHVFYANHYKITVDDEIVGFFAIHEGENLTLFHVLPHHANQSQEIFAYVKKYENVTSAMVATSDEFFLSHCLDGFDRMEKQAYFAVYTEKGVAKERKKTLNLRIADIDIDKETLSLSGDFLDHPINNIRDGRDVEIYIAEFNGDIVGFGVVEYGRIVKSTASIGMFVCPSHRKAGFAANILEHLKLACFEKGLRVVSGCWYYNHNSKKSMEAAGAYSKTRLVKFYF